MKSSPCVLLSCLLLVLCVEAARRSKRTSDDLQNRRRDHNREWGYFFSEKEILPEEWADQFPKCSGHKQSPISIHMSETHHHPNLRPIHLFSFVRHSGEYANDERELWEIKNVGESINIRPVNRDYLVRFGGRQFKLKQLHPHWRDSEHILDEHQYDGELHLVFQDTRNPKILAVIAFFLQKTIEENLAFRPIIERIRNVREAGLESHTDRLVLENLIPMTIPLYYYYKGSLTTPGCDEIVHWHVVDRPLIGISSDQLTEFQSIADKEGFPVLKNNRPVQPLGDRIVYRSF